jgi:NAD(P)-dependent dehydrogenase (short-subunit alcohol dehydrogenase family)
MRLFQRIFMTSPSSHSQVVLITGALAGIGRATALAFAEAGAKVVISGRRPGAGAKLADEIRALGTEAEFIQADVSEEEDVRRLVDGVVARFGRLDVAVNSAGFEGKPGPIIELTPESYAAVFDTNVLGVLLSLKHELRVMAEQKSGSIINLSSTFGRIGGPNVALYVASKHAVEGLTKSAALEGAPLGIRVNVVAPGPVETEMLARLAGSVAGKEKFAQGVPLKRLGRPEEIAAAIVFVASPQASFISGASIPVNGGKAAL